MRYLLILFIHFLLFGNLQVYGNEDGKSVYNFEDPVYILEDRVYKTLEMDASLMEPCSFSGDYVTSFYNTETMRIQKVETFQRTDGYAILFLYFRQDNNTYYSQRLFLDFDGNVTGEGSVKTHSSPYFSLDYNFHYTATSTQGNNTFNVKKINSTNGATTWSRNYTINGANSAGQIQIFETENDRLVIKGTAGLTNTGTLFILTADTNGNQIGQNVHPPDGSGVAPDIQSATRTPNGGFLLYARFSGSRAAMINVNAVGALQYIDPGQFDLVTVKHSFVGIAQDGTGYYTAAGGGSNNFAYLRKSNLATGATLWQKNLKDSVFPNGGGDQVSFQWVQGATTVPGGGVTIGYRYRNQFPFEHKFYLLKYLSNGSTNNPKLFSDGDASPFGTHRVGNSHADGSFFMVSNDESSSGAELIWYNEFRDRNPACNGGGGCNVAASSANGSITITGLTSDANAKVFNANIQAVFSCNPWQGNVCTSNELASGLTVGATYFVSVQSGSCDLWIPIVVQGGGTTPNCNDGIQNQGEAGVDCGGPCTPCPGGGGCGVTISSANSGVLISGLTSNANAKLFDSNTQAVFACNPWQGNPCTITESFVGLNVGQTYFLSVQSPNCDEWIPVIIQGGGGCAVDSDNDGTCDPDDCQPTNPLFPATPGAPCNDFDSNTENDVIQPGGCSCEGTPIGGGGCNVNVTSGTSGVFITGLTSDANTKLFNSNTQAVFTCNPWQGNPCTAAEEQIGLPAGQYFLSVQSTDCNEWIPVTVGGGGQNGPDLTVDGVNIGVATPGTVKSFDFFLYNNGNTTASGSYQIKSYISTDNNLSSNDIQEGVINTGNTPPGSSTVTGAITVPSLPDGTYYLFVVVDDGNSISETNENNNIASGTLIISTGGGNGCNNPTNVALGKSVFQTSTLNFGGVNSDAAKAIDGNTDGNYYSGSVSATTQENSPYWQIDLGALYDVEQIKVWNRTDGTERLFNFWIMASDTPITATDVGSARLQSDLQSEYGGQAGRPTTISPNDTPIRYIRIQKNGFGYMIISEVEVLGCPSGLPDNSTSSFEKSTVEINSFAINELFPNPTTGEVIAKLESEVSTDISIQITNTFGQVISRKNIVAEIGNNTFLLDLEDYESGVYTITFTDGKDVVSKRVVRL